MIKRFSIFFILFFLILVSCSKDVKKSESLKESPFITLIKQKANTIVREFDLSVKINKSDALHLMWSGNGLVKTQKTKKHKLIKHFTHPINFANMLKVYYVDKNGIYRYNYNKSNIELVKKGDYLSFLKVPKWIRYDTPAHIFISIRPDKEKMLKGLSNYEGIYKQKLLNKIKNTIVDIYSDDRIKESSLLELGMAAQNIMLLSTAYNFSYYPISFQGSSERLKSYFKLDKNEKLFLAISLASKKDKKKNSLFINYVTKLIKNAKNHSPTKAFNNLAPVKLENIKKLLWVGNGIIKKTIGNKKTFLFTHSTLLNSLIDLYYITDKKLYKYDPIANKLLTKKHGDFRYRLGRMVTKYKAPGAIIITIKNKVPEVKNLVVPSKRTIRYYQRLFKYSNGLYYSSIIQAGGAIENIRLLATDFNLAYQLIEIRFNAAREKMRRFLSLDENNLPIFIIPIGNKKKLNN